MLRDITTTTAAVKVDFPCDPRTVPAARRLLEAALLASEAADERADELLVAISEACTNVVRHAQSDHYTVDIVVVDGHCTVTVVDRGRGFKVPDEPSMPPVRSPAGRGLAIIETLVDELAVHSEPGGGTRVVMRHSLR